MKSDIVEFYAELKGSTDAAYLLSDGVDDFWLPKSQIVEMNHIKGKDYEVHIPEWLAVKKGIV